MKSKVLVKPYLYTDLEAIQPHYDRLNGKDRKFASQVRDCIQSAASIQLIHPEVAKKIIGDAKAVAALMAEENNPFVQYWLSRINN